MVQSDTMVKLTSRPVPVFHRILDHFLELILDLIGSFMEVMALGLGSLGTQEVVDSN